MKCVYRVAFHSLTCSSIFLRVKICWMVLLFSRNPACSFLKMLSTPFVILLINTLPKIVLMTGKSVIPLQFVHSRKLPFLGTVTLLLVLCSSFLVLHPILSLCWTTLSTLLLSLPNLSLEALQLCDHDQLLSCFSLIL